MDNLLTGAEVAEILNVSPRTIERWRRQGRGPRWIRVEGQVRYPESDLRAYLDAAKETA